MRQWLIFLKERMPVPVLLLLSCGLAGSSLALDQTDLASWVRWLAVLQPGLFFLTLRFMDEVKDFEKDKIVHPQRPLPRGLLSVEEVRRAIYLGLAGMLALAFFWSLQGFGLAGALYVFTTLYLWLMYKEFFVGRSLEKNPFLYALTHQVILLPLAASVRALHGLPLSLGTWLEPGVMIMGAFFTYEICRKLDPEAHPLLRTYRFHYGESRTLLLLVFTTGLAIVGSGLSLGWESGQFVGLALVALACPLSYRFFLGRSHKIVEAVATVSLLVHMWWLFGRFLLGG